MSKPTFPKKTVIRNALVALMKTITTGANYFSSPVTVTTVYKDPNRIDEGQLPWIYIETAGTPSDDLPSGTVEKTATYDIYGWGAADEENFQAEAEKLEWDIMSAVEKNPTLGGAVSMLRVAETAIDYNAVTHRYGIAVTVNAVYHLPRSR